MLNRNRHAEEKQGLEVEKKRWGGGEKVLPDEDEELLQTSIISNLPSMADTREGAHSKSSNPKNSLIPPPPPSCPPSSKEQISGLGFFFPSHWSVTNPREKLLTELQLTPREWYILWRVLSLDSLKVSLEKSKINCSQWNGWGNDCNHRR